MGCCPPASLVRYGQPWTPQPQVGYHINKKHPEQAACCSLYRSIRKRESCEDALVEDTGHLDMERSRSI